MIEDKIKTIEELAEIVRKEKEAGRKVALCHGCFDLVHVGHMKHFAAAKKIADLLIVTVTPDCFITKGPGRPIFNESLRLEALANLAVIDHVGLNDAPDAVSLIERVKPSLYIKGDEYRNFKDNPTGKRIKEKEMVERYGGKLVFTSEPTFSSTSIINQTFNHLSPEVKNFIDQIRGKYTLDEINGYIDKMSELKILVIGDPIIDEYTSCRTVGAVTKSPTISAVYKDTTRMAGASLVVARHLAEFAKSVEYIGIVGDKDDGRSFIEEELGKVGVKSHLITIPNRFTTVKRRFVSGNYPTAVRPQLMPKDSTMYKLFEIAFMDDSLIEKDIEEKICSLIKERVGENDLVILTDFGHGMITPKITSLVAEKSKWWTVNAQTNSTNYGFNLITRYRNPNFVCIDETEARLPFGDRYKDRKEIIESLSQAVECNEIMMSMGKEGLLFKSDNIYYAPAITLKTVDTVGAGDAVLSMASLCRFLKLPPLATVFLSSVMGAMATQTVCNIEPVRKRKFVKFIKGTLSM